MPTLLEIERAVRASLLDPDDGQAARHILGDALPPEARLGIYRNTYHSTLVKALRLTYPAVEKLVGAEFFEAAARFFIDANPPGSACLDDYGAGFPDFLERFEPASSVAYLPDVARLEWAVSRSLHAPDAPALDLAALSEVPPEDHGRLCFTAHPSVGLVQVAYPADEIWRAVLADDDTGLAEIDLKEEQARLLVCRRETGIDVTGIPEGEGRFLAVLCSGEPLDTALESATDIDAPAVLARALTEGMFTSVECNSREQQQTEEAHP